MNKKLRSALLSILDLFIVCISVVFSCLLVNNFSLHHLQDRSVLLFSGYYLCSVLFFGVVFKVNAHLLRYFSLQAMWRMVLTAASSLLLSGLLLLIFNAATLASLSLSIVASLLYFTLSTTARIFYRLSHHAAANKAVDGRKTLIIGAGQAASILLKDMRAHKAGGLKPVALLDDDAALKNRYLHGVLIAGKCSELHATLEKHNIDLVIVAIPSLMNKNLLSLVSDACLEKNVELRILPGLSDLVDGKVSINALRPVAAEDLLGREQVAIDQESICGSIRGLCVLVTGGGGSIGSELARQIAHYQPERIIILDHSEYNIFSIEHDLKNKFPKIQLILRLGSVTDETLVQNIVELYKPQLIFHVAAYKQVPLLEEQPVAAMINNIHGTFVMANAALRGHVKNFILISTDKAVNPTNIMGATKRVAELICQLCAQVGKSKFSIVRFGNVLDSVGSVIPMFREQIRTGGPVTVTHPNITRYFMTIPEACKLILKVMQINSNGNIFVLDMGDPIKIDDLARNMIRLSGKKLGEDIEIAYTGLRPGEKLHEELFHQQENLQKTVTERVFATQSRDLNWTAVDENIKQLLAALEVMNKERAIYHLRQLVPEAQLDHTISSESLTN